MNKGDIYIIKYLHYGKQIVATFYEEANDVYFFSNEKDKFFGVSKKAIKEKEIALELAEEG